MNYSGGFLKNMYVNLLKARMLEEKIVELYHQGRVPGSVHSGVGEEATFVGGCLALNEDDYMMTTHRAVCANWTKGIEINKIFCDLFGKKEGTNCGKGAAIRICSEKVLGMSGTQGGVFVIATGAALSLKLLNKKSVVLAFFGDNTSNRGTFHESLNIASLWKLPVIFLCDNNQYGISINIKDSTSVENIADRGVAYNIPTKIVDGNSILAVYEATKEAVNHAKSGNGPYLIEAKTYRFRGHMEGDQRSYRTREEESQWMEKCPLRRFENKLLEQGVITDTWIVTEKNKIEKEIENAISFAENSIDPGKEDLFKDIYA
jgi:pyruvate dehydrogenase E1 component alpha subunit